MGANRSDGEKRAVRRSLHPTVKATGFVSFFTDMGSEIIYPILGVFATGGLGLSREMFGLIEGLAEGFPRIVGLFSGAISDRVKNRKWVIFLGYSISTAMKPLIGFAAAGWQLLTFRVLDRLGKGIRGTPRDALVADCTDPDMRGHAFGYQRAMDNAGALAGGLIAFVLLRLLGFSMKQAIIVSIVPGVLAVATILLFIREKPDRKIVGQSGLVNPFSGLRAMPREFFVYVGATSIFAVANSSDAFLLLRSHQTFTSHLHDVQKSVPLLCLLWALLHFVKSLTSLWGGKLSDRVGRLPVLVIGWALYSVVYLGFAFMESFWAPWVLFALYGVFYGMTEGASRAAIADIVPEGRRGAAFGFWSIVEGILLIVASVLTGWLWDVTGKAEAALLLCGALSLVATLYLAVWALMGGLKRKGPLEAKA